MSERDMTRLIALLEQRLGVQWADVVEWLREQNGIAALEAKLVSGRIDDVVADVAEAAERFATNLHSAYLDAGSRASAWLDRKVTDRLIHFDASAPEVVARARAEAASQVIGLTQESRETVRGIIVDGVTAGLAPRESARRIRDSIGLSEPQVDAMANYRRALEEGRWSRALSYELRDARADQTIRRLQRDGGGLSPARIDTLSERYRQNAIVSRAELIARTESMAAAHRGGDDAMTQAIRSAKIDARQLETEWHSGPPTRYARPDHRKMDGKRVGFGTDFTLPDGTLMRHPGDLRGGAKHNANCRCTRSTTFVILEDLAAA